MSKIEEVINALQQVGDNIDTTGQSASNALTHTDEAIAGAQELGANDKVQVLEQIKSEIEHLQQGVQGLKDTTEGLMAHANVVAGGS